MLSKIVEAYVNTYENPVMDTVYDQMKYDLEDCKVEIKKEWWWHYDCIKLQDWFADINNIEIEDWLDFDEFKKNLWSALQTAIENDIINICWFDLECMFKNYGIQYKGMNFYTPKAYNFESDSLDIRLELIDENWDIDKYKLRELAQEYIDTVMKRSCDWYMSFEESDVDKLVRDDYAILRAILKKEDVSWYIKQAIDWVMEDLSEIVWNNCKPHYLIRIDGTIDWENKYKLDYDSKMLIKID